MDMQVATFSSSTNNSYSNSSFTLNSTKWTVIAVCKYSSAEDWQVLFGLGNSTNFNFIEYFDNYYNYNVVVANFNANTEYAEVTDGVPATKYCVITWIYDGTQNTNATKLKCYINGVQQTLTFTGTIPSSMPGALSPAYLGMTTGFALSFNFIGMFAALSYFNDALTSANQTYVETSVYKSYYNLTFP